jgi:glycosyltransferase involved in cell wall biosynthesis
MTRVSVICCFYRRPQAVRRTLLGLKRQKFQDFEAIIADDGSGDDTAEVIRQTLAELADDRFRLVARDKNIGLTRGLIEGVAEAKGEYIAIHDAGDVSLAGRLGAQSAALDADPRVVVVGCHYVNFIESAGLYRIRQPDAGEKSLGELRADTTFTHGEVMFRKSAYEEAGGYRTEFRMSQDNDLWMRMMKLGSFATVPEILYIRSVDFDGISFNRSTIAKQSAFYILGKKIAAGNVDEAKVLSRLSSGDSILDVMPLSDADVQRQIEKVAIRSAVFGEPKVGYAIAQEYLEASFKKRAVAAALWFLSKPAGRTLLPGVRSALGMRAGIPDGWIDS